MARLIEGLDVEQVQANFERISAEIADAASGRDVELLAAVKYVRAEELPVLAQAGIRLVGENRAQELQAKHAAHSGLFEWDFIGQLQSRKVKDVIPHARLIHSVASESALAALERHLPLVRPDLEILIEVNIAAEPEKAGVSPAQLGEFIARSPVPVAGLMTMPPLAERPEQSRQWFAKLRELAETHSLQQLSMGTSQDYLVAVEEGATIVRIGSSLYE